MEFEQMKKIWDTQNQKPMYVFDEDALHNRIRSKKRKSQRLASLSEYVLIISTIFAGSLILVKNLFFNVEPSIFKYAAGSFFYLITIFLFYQRSIRKSEEQNFGQTILDDLKHALSNATYQVRLSAIMMNIIYPAVSLLAVLKEWISSGFSWTIPAIALFFTLTFYAVRWEHRLYESKLKELINLENKLLEEPSL